jgi:hypothetical protein
VSVPRPAAAARNWNGARRHLVSGSHLPGRRAESPGLSLSKARNVIAWGGAPGAEPQETDHHIIILALQGRHSFRTPVELSTALSIGGLFLPMSKSATPSSLSLRGTSGGRAGEGGVTSRFLYLPRTGARLCPAQRMRVAGPAALSRSREGGSLGAGGPVRPRLGQDGSATFSRPQRGRMKIGLGEGARPFIGSL